MKYLTRAQWGATFDVSSVPLIHLPVSLIFVHHNVIPPTDNPSFDMEKTEQTDIRRFGKPSYDWGIHPTGVVLDGMTSHLSPDTIGHNSDSLSIMFMGDFRTDQPTDAAMLSGRELVQQMRDGGWVHPLVTIKGHRDVFPTACPGDNLYSRIQELAVPLITQENDMTTVFIIAKSNGATPPAPNSVNRYLSTDGLFSCRWVKTEQELDQLVGAYDFRGPKEFVTVGHDWRAHPYLMDHLPMIIGERPSTE